MWYNSSLEEDLKLAVIVINKSVAQFLECYNSEIPEKYEVAKKLICRLLSAKLELTNIVRDDIIVEPLEGFSPQLDCSAASLQEKYEDFKVVAARAVAYLSLRIHLKTRIVMILARHLFSMQLLAFKF